MPSLGYRDYRNFQSGSFISNVGTTVQRAAIFWHVFTLTHNNLLVGAIGLVRVLPLLLFGLFGGVMADHYDRRSVILWSQSVMALVALMIAVLTFFHLDSLAWLYVVVGLSAAAQAFNGPARQAMMANMVPAEHFPNAASINGIVWRLSDVLGPVIAGFLIASHGLWGFNGLALSYSFNFLSFIAVLIAVWALPKRPPTHNEATKKFSDVIESIRDGFTFVRKAQVLRNAMWIDFWGTFLSGAEALLPAFATSILLLDSRGYGILAAAGGSGAMIAAMAMAWIPTIKRQGRWVIIMIALYGAFTILFGVSQSLWTAIIFLAATGAADMISTVLRQTIRQLATPDSMRGRMSSIGMLFQVSGPQLGDFEAGALAHGAGGIRGIGERGSIIAGGLGCFMVTLWYWMRGRALRDYEHTLPL